jgi:uncharacterized protein (TIGR02996 family)
MDQLAALRAAVYAAPDDDAPRLVLADYLLERGDPRGELIHVQCAIARGDHAEALLAREQALLRDRPRGPIPMAIGYDRGLARAILEADRTDDKHLRFLDDEPLVQHLTITRCGGTGEAGWKNVARIIERVLERIRVLELNDVSWEVPTRATYLPFTAPFDGRASCAAMFAALPPRPPMLAEIWAHGVELPVSWRR